MDDNRSSALDEQIVVEANALLRNGPVDGSVREGSEAGGESGGEKS